MSGPDREAQTDEDHGVGAGRGPAPAQASSWTELLRGPVATESPAQRATLLRLQRAAGNARVAHLLREVAPPAAPGAENGATALLVEEAAGDPGAGRMAVGRFLDEIERAVTEVAEKEIGAVFEVVGCPWLAHWIGYYRKRTASDVEAALKRYAPAAARAKTAQEYVDLVVARVREGIATWRVTGETPELPAGSPGAPPGAGAPQDGAGPGGGAPPPAFKMRGDRSGPDVGTGGLGGRLGAGERLDGATAGAIGSAFGADLSDVSVHRDAAAAQVVGGMGARAVALGRDVAFAPGQYEPGTPVGDALIAHELAHVVQQTAPGGAGADAPTLEKDADSAAMDAVAARWSGGAARAPARAANPLRAQSCPASYEKEGELVGDEAEALAKKFKVVLHSNPAYIRDQTVPIGFQPRFWLTAPETLGQGGRGMTHHVANWHVAKPDSDPRRVSSTTPGSLTVEMDEKGLWIVFAKVVIDKVDAYLVRQYHVQPMDDLADEAFKDAKTADYVSYRTMLTQERMKRAGGVDLDQSKASGAWITNETAGAANPSGPSMDSMSFRVHPDPKAPPEKKPAKYRWWAMPSGHDEHDYTGRTDLGPRTNYKGSFAFFRGESETATFRADSSARIEMVCELIGADDKLVGTASYTQMVMDRHERESVAQIDKLIKDGAADFKKIEANKARGLKAMHYGARKNQPSSLNMFIGPKAGDPSKTMLVDLTPGAEFVEHEGKSVEDALDHLDDNNSYATGQLLIHFDGPPAVDKRFKTDGDTDLEDAAGKTGIGSAILVALGVVAMATGVGSIAAPFLIAGGLAAGVASGGMSIASELRKAEPSGMKISLDVAGIVGALAGAGGMAQAVRMGSVELAMATAAGRFFIYTGFAFDATGGLLLVADTADKIEQVRKNPTMSDDEKIDAIQKLIVQAVVVGGLIAWGARDIGSARTRVSGLVGDVRVATLRPEQLYTLQSLDDEVLRALREVPVDDFEAVAAAMTKDPRKASTLSKAFGKKFIDEVRANPGRSLDETAEVLGGKAAGAAVGGTMGADVYRLDPKGGIRSKDRFKDGLEAKNLREGRLHGTTIDATAINGEKDALHAVLDVTVNGEKVRVTVKPTPTAKLAGGVHGDDGGAGRIVDLKPPAGGQPWRAEVQLDNQLTRDLVPPVLGHELDEIADFIVTKGGAGIGTLKSEMEAGIFIAWSKRAKGGPPPSITSHDRAAAREWLNIAAEMREAQVAAAKPKADASYAKRADARRETLDKLTQQMGLLDPQHIEIRLKTLRESLETMDDRRKGSLLKPDDTTKAVLIDDLMDRVRRGVTTADVAVARGAVGAKTVFDDRLVAHLMRAAPNDAETFARNGINGGHHDGNLKQFVAANPEYAIVQSNEATSGFVTYRTYRQYRWNDKTRPPIKHGDPGHPANPTAPIDPAWKPAPVPKTTFDEEAMFFADTDKIIGDWKGRLTDPQYSGSTASPQKVGTEPSVTIYFDYTAADAVNNKPAVVKISTVFVDENWVRAAEAAAATPTPAPTGATR